MLTCAEETRTLRRRLQELENALSQGTDDTRICSAAFVGKTTTITTYPTTANSYYGVLPVRLYGEVAEGMGAMMSFGETPTLAYNIGGSVPPSGTEVEVCQAGGRWVFRYDASS